MCVSCEFLPAAGLVVCQAPSPSGRRDSLEGDGHAGLSHYNGSLHKSTEEGGRGGRKERKRRRKRERKEREKWWERRRGREWQREGKKNTHIKVTFKSTPIR